MLPIRALTADQVDTFKDDGFVVTRGLFDQEQVSNISDWSDEMLSKPEVSGEHWVYHEKSLNAEGQDLISRIEHLSPFHAGFRSLVDALNGPASQLLGEDAILFKEKINHLILCDSPVDFGILHRWSAIESGIIAICSQISIENGKIKFSN